MAIKNISSALIALLILNLPAYSQPVRSSPVSISEVAEKGEDVIDYFLAEDWTGAKALVADIALSEEMVTSAMHEQNLPIASTYVYEYLVSELQRLTEQADQPVQASLTANQTTAFLIGLQGLKPQTVPIEISWMDYLGREMMLQAKAKTGSGILPIRIEELTAIWEGIKPDILARKGTATASRIDTILVDLKGNNDYNKMADDAANMLELVDDLEKLYR